MCVRVCVRVFACVSVLLPVCVCLPVPMCLRVCAHVCLCVCVRVCVCVDALISVCLRDPQNALLRSAWAQSRRAMCGDLGAGVITLGPS